MTGFMGSPFVEGLTKWRKASDHISRSERQRWETDSWRNWEFKCSDLGNADPVFETGAASLYLPAFHELVLAEGVSPPSPVLEAPRSMIELREQKLTRAHRKPLSAITSIVRDLCRQAVFTRLNF